MIRAIYPGSFDPIHNGHIDIAKRATKLAFFEGIEKIHFTDLHLSLDKPDSVEPRIDAIMNWLSEIGVGLDTLDGICCRSGFFNAVTTGTYRIVPDMLSDLARSRFEHPSNLSVPLVTTLAKMSEKADSLLLTTSDPSVSDEIEITQKRHVLYPSMGCEETIKRQIQPQQSQETG